MPGLNRIVAAIAFCSTVFLVSAPGSVNAVSIGAQPHLRPRAHGHSHHDRSLSLAERHNQHDLRVREAPRPRCKPKSPPSHPTTKTKPCKPKSTPTSHPDTTKTKPCKPKSTPTSHPGTTKTKPYKSKLTPASTRTTTTTHSTRTSPSNTPTSPGNKKVGLAWSGNDDHLLKYFVTDKTKFVYTWSPHCPKGYESTGLQCARMLWGYKDLVTFRKLRRRPGTSTIMGMNEVNQPHQANLTPQQGIQLWNTEIRPLGQEGYTLVSPSVTCQDSGLAWFRKFFDNCGGTDKCGVHILSIHIYMNNATKVMETVEEYHKHFGLPIWVSEYACEDFSGENDQCSPSHIWQFVETLTKWFDEKDYVYAHFPFGFLKSLYNVNPDNKLIDSNGMPNDLGKFILNS